MRRRHCSVASRSSLFAVAELLTSIMSKRTQMKCRLCKNHGILTPLRGHKFKCRFRNCSCFNCKTTQMRNRQQDESRRAVKDVESTVNQRIYAWINGEEIQDDSVGEDVFVS